VHTSPLGKALCKSMLAFTEQDRPTMVQCFEHKWFYANASTLMVVPPEQLRGLHDFSKLSALKRSLLMEIASKLPMKHSKSIAEFFQFLDNTKGDGGITRADLERGFAGCGIKDPSVAAKTFDSLDINGDGVLTFNELAAGVLVVFDGLLKERFRALFQRHDKNQDGFLDREELGEFLGSAVLQFAASESHKKPEEIVGGILGKESKLSYEEVERILLPRAR